MPPVASCFFGACWLTLIAAAASPPQLVTVLNPAQSPPDGGCADSVAPIISPDGRFGRQFTFIDLDGYAITIYDRDAPAEGWDDISSFKR